MVPRGVGGSSPSNIAQRLKGIDFPVEKQGLIQQAQKNGAEKEVLDTLRQLPDQQFGNMADVMKSYGKVK